MSSKCCNCVSISRVALTFYLLVQPEHELELLDSPGIIPARQEDQNQALKLAICNDIGQASYDTQVSWSDAFGRIEAGAVLVWATLDMLCMLL